MEVSKTFNLNRTLSVFGVILLVFMVSCASTPKEKVDPAVQEDINKKTTAVTNIAKLMAAGNLEGAFYRMDENYRYENTIDDFQQQWADVSEGKGKITGYTVDSSEFAKLGYYKTLKVVYNLEKGDLTVRYLFNSAMPVPMDVVFGDSGNITAGEQVPLKDLCKDYFKFGCGITGAGPSASAIRVPQFMEIVKTNFSSCTSTNLMKPGYILNQNMSMKNAEKGINEPVLDFTSANPTLEWCKNNGVSLRGHTLVWHAQTPDWYFREGFKNDGEYVSRQVMIERLDSYVKQYFTYVQENYPGVVYCWDVVNEAVDPDLGDTTTDFMCRKQSGGQKNGWYYTIGNDYPEVAFTIARKYAADGVKLIYNDYGTVGTKKRECIYNLCKSLAEKGLIDGIGMQSNWGIKSPTIKEIKEAINRYSELNLEIMITEWSIGAPSETADGFNQQAERYASILKLLQSLDTQGGGNANITCVSFFGVQDKFVLNPKDTSTERLWDTDFNPKPVYYSISDVLKLYY